MAYKTGFKAPLEEAEEKKFFDALGMSKEALLRGVIPPQQWPGWPNFQARVDTWIEVYRAYVKSLDIHKKAALHRSIDRLFFSLKEGKFVSEIDYVKNRERYRKNYIIPERMTGSEDARYWLYIAGAYTYALMEKNREELRKQRIAQFETEMPLEWLIIEAAGYSDQVQRRAFTKFVNALQEHWNLFVDSYRNEVHGTVVNNYPVAASLNSFLEGHYPDGRPLNRPNPLIYWPRPLSHYAAHHTARGLFEAKICEIEALKPILSSANGSAIGTINAFPRWLRLGIDGVDPRPRPPQWKPKHHT